MNKVQLELKTRIRTIILIGVVCSITIIGCNPNEIYSEHFETGAGLEWTKDDSKTFDVVIENADLKYNVYITFRYATGYASNVAPVLLSQTEPDGETESNEYQLRIKDDKGDYIGEPGYDIWDSKHPVAMNVSLQKGKHTFKLEHNADVKALMPVMDVGLIVENVE